LKATLATPGVGRGRLHPGRVRPTDQVGSRDVGRDRRRHGLHTAGLETAAAALRDGPGPCPLWVVKLRSDGLAPHQRKWLSRVPTFEKCQTLTFSRPPSSWS